MKHQTTTKDRFSIFGINIDNMSMNDSVESILSSVQLKTASSTKTACFVNANSLNQAYSSPELTEIINRHDYVFPDGSGVRMAANNIGVTVKDNVNGTDMLPILCSEAVKYNRSIFLLGASKGIAAKTASNLKKKFPGLKIAGTHHGFIDEAGSIKVIDKINRSQADILLVGMGTPIQENWVQTYAPRLKTSIAIAVGGLFDFYSGRIPRAPMFFRQHGIEWVWRLLQEPKTKFHRYVIGNPLFLLRIAFN